MSTDSFGGLFGSGAASTADSALQGASATGTALPSGDVANLVSPATSVASTGATSAPLAAPGNGSGFFSGVGNLLSKVPAAPLVTGGAALANLIRGPGKIAEKGQIQNIAGQETAAGGQLINAMVTGQLPPGEEQQVDQQLQAQISSIKQKYAQMGLSGSSMEQQDIANAQNNAVAQRSQLAQQATQQGMELLNAGGTAYGQIAQAQTAQDNELQNSLAQMMAAFGKSFGSTD